MGFITGVTVPILTVNQTHTHTLYIPSSRGCGSWSGGIVALGSISMCSGKLMRPETQPNHNGMNSTASTVTKSTGAQGRRHDLAV